MGFELSPQVGRRGFLVGAGGAAMLAAAPGAAQAGARPFVASESGRLRRVLVHAAGPADHAGCGLLAGGDPFWREAADALVAQNAAMIRELEATGARVVRLENALEGAIHAARGTGALDGWLLAHFPELAASPRVTSAALLGQAEHDRDDAHRLGNLRDFAVMLPAGLVLGHAADSRLARPEAIVRFALRHSPELRGYPVLFDARARGVRAHGGDILVVGRRTLLVGIGNHSEARLAPALAAATGMEVIAVALLAAGGGGERLEHLHSGAAQLAPDRLVALPSAMTAPAVVYSGEGEGPARVALADALRARGITVLPMPNPRAARFLPTEPGAVLADAGLSAVLRRSGLRTAAVGPDESWLGHFEPNRLVLPLERG